MRQNRGGSLIRGATVWIEGAIAQTPIMAFVYDARISPPSKSAPGNLAPPAWHPDQLHWGLNEPRKKDGRRWTRFAPRRRRQTTSLKLYGGWRKTTSSQAPWRSHFLWLAMPERCIPSSVMKSIDRLRRHSQRMRAIGGKSIGSRA